MTATEDIIRVASSVIATGGTVESTYLRPKYNADGQHEWDEIVLVVKRQQPAKKRVTVRDAQTAIHKLRSHGMRIELDDPINSDKFSITHLDFPSEMQELLEENPNETIIALKSEIRNYTCNDTK